MGSRAEESLGAGSSCNPREPGAGSHHRRGPIVGMVPVTERGEDAVQRAPRCWEGDLIIDKNGSSCAAALMERMTGFTVPLALPLKYADGTADAVIEYLNELPEMMRASLV